MDGGDRWRVITCAAGDKDKTIINRVMLRFRPIAPKPVDGGSSSGAWKPENKNGAATNGRTKRKYVRVKKNNEYLHRRRRKSNNKKNNNISSDQADPTLQLLPHNTDLNRPVETDQEEKGSGPDQAAVVETLVTVESVEETCMEVALGGTDAERKSNLEADTCPGFLSDGLNSVQWVNEAYRKMVAAGGGSPPTALPEVRVWLVIKEKLLPYYQFGSAFTCWVRLQYTCQKEKCSQMVPCDVWRMDFGGFAWRLDVKAALSLGI